MAKAVHNLNNIWLRENWIREHVPERLCKTILKPMLIYKNQGWSLTVNDDHNLSSITLCHFQQWALLANQWHYFIFGNPEKQMETLWSHFSFVFIWYHQSKIQWDIIYHHLRIPALEEDSVQLFLLPSIKI